MIDSDKLFVVVAVIAIIFVGLLIYLFSLDRKIHRLEKRLNEKSDL
jgi:CcmD family protein